MKKILLPTAILAGLIACFAGPMTARATTTPTPIIYSISLTKGVYKTIINKKNVPLKPFPGYTGSVWAKRVYFGNNLGSTYLFVQRSPGTTASVMKYYETSTSRMWTITPFYGNHKKGYNASVVVQPKTKKVYIALGTKATGVSARVMEITRKGINQVNNPTVAETQDKGVVLVQFLKLYPNEYGLVTMITNKPATVKTWRYSSTTHRFDEDIIYDKSRIKTTGNVLSL